MTLCSARNATTRTSARPRRHSRRLLPALLFLLAGCSAPPRWNVLLVTFDTTRADFIGCYGKAEARTPVLDGLAAEGFLFEQAVASNPVTQPSHSTILTGTYPLRHGVRDNGLFKLPEVRRTLAELLGEQGYRTAAAVGGFPLVASFGLDQGFDFYDDELATVRQDLRGRPAPRRRPTWYDERPAGHVNDAILPWLRQRSTAPFFVWLHYWDPHEPHIPPSPYDELFADDLYSGEIAYADQSLGTVLRELEDLGELDRTLIVMTADHGEGRYEHEEVTHAFLAYGTTLHVPLIVRVPGFDGGKRITDRVGTVDIVPTVLDLLDVDIGDDVQGRSLVPLMRDPEARRARRLYYSESLSPRLSHGFGELRVLYQGSRKFIYGPRPELYDLDEDPHERHDLLAENGAASERLEAALAEFLAEHASDEASGAVAEVDPEIERKLAALGYLSTSGEAPTAVSEVLRRDGVPPQDRVQDINLAMRLRNELGSGRYFVAKQTAQKLLAGAPQHAFYRSMLVQAHLGLEELDEAVRVVEETENISTVNIDAFLAAARRLFDDRDQGAGLRLAQRLVAAEETANGQATIATMLLELGDGEAFEPIVRRALELEPSHRQARLALVDHLIETDRYEPAEAELRRHFASYPADGEAELSYAKLLRREGRTETALEHATRAVRLLPASCESHEALLELLLELERASEASAAHGDFLAHCRDAQARARVAALMEGT